MNQAQTKSTEGSTTAERFGPNEAVIHRFLRNAPLMCVAEVVRYKDSVSDKNKLVGIKCYWFDENGNYHSEIFETPSIRKATQQELTQLQAVAA